MGAVEKYISRLCGVKVLDVRDTLCLENISELKYRILWIQIQFKNNSYFCTCISLVFQVIGTWNTFWNFVFQVLGEHESKLKFEIENSKLKLKLKWKIEFENWNWNWKLKLKIKIESWN